MRPFVLGLVSALAATAPARALEPIPDRLVVLTFDDSSRSHIAVAAPVLKKHGFGATFFVTEGFDFATNKRDYMTWEEIAQLHRDGFEVGNHTRDHRPPSARDPEGTLAQLADCPPGESRTVRGWVTYYEGTDIDGEMRRLSLRIKN